MYILPYLLVRLSIQSMRISFYPVAFIIIRVSLIRKLSWGKPIFNPDLQSPSPILMNLKRNYNLNHFFNFQYEHMNAYGQNGCMGYECIKGSDIRAGGMGGRVAFPPAGCAQWGESGEWLWGVWGVWGTYESALEAGRSTPLAAPTPTPTPVIPPLAPTPIDTPTLDSSGATVFVKKT
jgi:hypothetical protein